MVRSPSNKVEELHQELLSLVRTARRTGEQRLPTEAELADIYSVSRSTVRDALTRLAASGEIERRRYFGTLVLPKPNGNGSAVPAFPADIIHSLSEFLAAEGLRYAVTDLRITQEESTPDVRERLEIDDDIVYRVVRVYEVEGRRSAYLEHILPRSTHGYSIDATKLTEGVTTFLQETVGAKISHVEAVITAEAADTAVCEALHLDEGMPVLSMYTVIKGLDAVPLALGRLVFDPRLLRLSVGASGAWTLGHVPY